MFRRFDFLADAADRGCDRHLDALLDAATRFTQGFGRTGKWFACEESRVVPGFGLPGEGADRRVPALGLRGQSADVMDRAWPVSSKGEAIHTSTFQGNPVGCAMALAQIAEVRGKRLPQRAAQLGRFLLEELHARMPSAGVEIRGRGLMAGVELKNRDGSPATDRAFAAIKEMLRRGFILLPEGEHGNVISFTPPLTISRSELAAAVRALGEILS
jgi:4-aminobutyrate aminotransferase-like enzyme